MILSSIHSPEDVRALPTEQLPELCRELRMELLRTVSKTGGHLASNLGVVELTVAIHRVFDTARDRLVFDVGHQCYVHKMLTGRREAFSTLRQYGGLSGFPKPNESVHDAFIAGHASNSVSVALGMARARSLQKENYHVLALIGDGALSGGLAYEGLNNAGASGEKLIVILNDNEMSIAHNVGAVSRHLARIRSRAEYYHLKKSYRALFGPEPEENPFYRALHSVKQDLKHTVLPGSTLFEEMGFTYIGPVDGHDLNRLIDSLTWAKECEGPVLVHVKTRKGKGCRYAEAEPEQYHGVGPFDIKTGEPLKKSGESFSSAFGAALCDLAAADPKIAAITAAMPEGTGLECFEKRYPKRFCDVAIAEGHAASMAAGFSAQGMTPVFAVYSTFLQRAFDQLVHDISLEGLHAVIAVDRAGLVGPDGETHQGVLDVQFLSTLPGFTVLAPASFAETRSMLRQALYDYTGPVALRYPRGGEQGYTEDSSAEPCALLREGTDACILTYGILTANALAAADILAEKNISCAVLKLNRLNPLPEEELLRHFKDTRCLLVAEDAYRAGAVGERVAALLLEKRCIPERLLLVNLGASPVPAGSVAELQERYGLSARALAERVVMEVRP